MRDLLNLFLDICLFRKGPQDTPASKGLLRMCVSAYALSGFLVLLLNTPAETAILLTLLDRADRRHRPAGPHEPRDEVGRNRWI